ncbi:MULTISPECIES: hypothetical protein [Bradyrhizobium]|nr:MULTISPECIES: hypothetical protein [Bradyrhizobium]
MSIRALEASKSRYHLVTNGTGCAGDRKMDLTDIQDYAIQARMALIVGAETFDRVFTGIRFAEVDGPLLYVYAKDEASAAEIEDDFALHISIIASGVLGLDVDVVVVLPKVLQ